MSCFFARTQDDVEMEEFREHPNVKLLMEFLVKHDRVICKIFKKLWDYSMKDPIYLKTFLNVLINWGNNKIFASRYFIVCEGIYGSIF